MNTIYSYWKHASGEVYAVKVSKNGVILGICGPLHHSEYGREELLPDYDYNAEDINWATAEDDAGRWIAL